MVRPGERLAVDGIVTEGSSYVDESMISGEPVPVDKSLSDEVIGGTVNKTGAFTLKATRVGADTVLAVIASATILFASLRALGETHLKRRLAYSTVSQLSYIVLGAALGSVTALAGAMFHIAAHGFMKITMFFCAGAIHTESHRDDITQLAGIGRQMPITMTAFAIAAAGLAGTPLLAGFVSKWNLGLGALEAGQGVFIAVLVTSGLLNMAYFFPIVYDAFFKPAHGEVTPERLTLTLPLATTAVAALVLGIMPDFGAGFYRLAWSAAMSVVAGSAAGGVP